MSRYAPHTTPALEPEDAARLAEALSALDVSLFVDGTAHRLAGPADAAVRDLLARLARGEAVTVSSAEDVLTVAQAAELAGISHSYVRKLTTNGTWPVEYRGTHRRIKREDVLAWVAAQGTSRQRSAEGQTEG
ncbi:excisionase [Sinomonas cellulolyticus]|uniref:Excisionase family DNA-binding protein n=1 Tax=Sinomonas cellulolyticus TaxID=2801916 RepID=A0ABS1K8U3_9MICC|nr:MULTISPECIES: excisionase family DNA-binding protein [Sinomonas]MBL0707307.1 excisionase family DNA-binding protein [Sinomonas cellulolyticus]GHG50580.1 excisionase [Sinomonas sp. KCTC 49339]